VPGYQPVISEWEPSGVLSVLLEAGFIVMLALRAGNSAELGKGNRAMACL